MTISRSSALSINVLLMFEMHDLNGAILLNATFFSALSFSFEAAAKRSFPLLQQYSHHYSHINNDSHIEVLNLIFLLAEYWPLDKSFISIHFLSQILIELNRLIV